MNSRDMNHSAPKHSSSPKKSQSFPHDQSSAHEAKIASNLLWHGGVSYDGSLWLAPLLMSVDQKLKGSQYVSRLKQALEHPSTLAGLKTLGWSEIDWVEGSVSYPYLTEEIPLPTREWLSSFLDDEGYAHDLRKAVETRYQNATTDLKYQRFRCFLLQIRTHPQAGIAEALIGATALGLNLTPAFRRLLEAWLEFCQAIQAAKAADQWTIWSRGEIGQILNWDFFRQLDVRTSFHSKRTWSAFVRSRAETEASIVEFVKDPRLRMDDLSVREMIDLHVTADFDDRSPRSSDLPSWCILPDMAAERLLDFVDKTCQITYFSSVFLDHGPEETAVWPFMARRLRAGFEEWTDMVRDPALKLAFSTIFEQAITRNLYQDIPLKGPTLLTALARRYEPNGLLQILWGHQEARCQDSSPGILRHRLSPRDLKSSPSDHRLMVRLEPVLMHPNCAATRISSRIRRFPDLQARYINLDTWMKEPSEASCLVMSPDAPHTTISVPQLKSWQAADYLWLLSANPDLFANTLVLDTGAIDVSEDHPTLVKLAATESSEKEVSSSFTAQDAYDLLAWSTTMSPWPSLEPSAEERLRAEERSISLIDGGLSTPTLRLGIRYECDGDRDVAVSSLLRSTQALLSKKSPGPRGGEPSPISQSQLSEIFASASQSLTFRAVPYFMVDQQPIAESAWFAAKKSGKDYFVLPDGTLISALTYQAFTDRFVARKRVLAKYQEVTLKDLWKVHREATREEAQTLPPREYASQMALTLGPIFENLDQALLGPLIDQWVKPCLGALSERLRPYQIYGIAWMYQRLETGLGVCLADEMGLGKTAQAIGLISLRAASPSPLQKQAKSQKRTSTQTSETDASAQRPALVVVPKSLLLNWQRELHQFAPHLRVGLYPQDAQAHDVHVLITTYARLRMHADDLGRRKWGLVILDEAQNIKNTDSQTTNAARSLDTSGRVALTGTPIENHAGEIWSLLDWLNPGYLGSAADFTSYVRAVRAAEQRNEALRPLRECLRPVLLRRLKDDPDIALSLPPKIAETLTAVLSPEQSLLYRSVLEVVANSEGDLATSFVRRAAYLKAILHLKQICNHPDVFYGDQTESQILATVTDEEAGLSQRIRQVIRAKLRAKSTRKDQFRADDETSRSGKLSILKELLLAMKGQSSGILIFTQFRSTAIILQNLLKTLEEPAWQDVPFLHGGLSPQERQDLVDDFTRQSQTVCIQRERGDFPGCPILILSLKAGGTGLNLTAADRVIHFDRWWNPAVEDQATDRAHRLGQTKPVFIYNITTEGTIEASIARVFETKRSLALDFLGGEAASEIGEYLQDQSGFLHLVDPDGLFVSRVDGYSPADLAAKEL